MAVTELVAAVRKTGFKTRATEASFYKMVSIALVRDKRFRKVARGRYVAR
jgi:hypothetical protein